MSGNENNYGKPPYSKYIVDIATNLLYLVGDSPITVGKTSQMTKLAIL